MRQFPRVTAQSLEPDPLLAELLNSEPVSRVRLPFGEPCWLVTRYEDVRAVLSDPRFSRAATGLRDRTQEVVDGLLEDMERTGPPADLVEALALPLPIMMICELLGVPFADRDRFRRWADTFMTSSGFTRDEVIGAHAQIGEYLAHMVNQRREQPTEDLLSALVAARDDDDERITEPELISLALAILVAGYETTASQLAKFMLCLFGNPEQLAFLRAQPEMIPNAVEELMRLISLSAGTSLAHLATEDMEIGGVTIRAGEAVVASTAAANRDGAVFKDPDRLDVTRESIVHFGFGHGAHYCLGAHLARLELQVAITSLLARFPELHLAVPDYDVVWKDGSAVWGLQALPVAF